RSPMYLGVEAEVLGQNGNGHVETEADGLVVLTRPFEAIDPLDALTAGAGGERVFWQSPNGEMLIGLGVAHRVKPRRALRFRAAACLSRALFQRLQVEGDPNAPAPVLMGGFAFDERNDGLWRTFGSAQLLLPRITLRQTSGGSWLSVAATDRASAERLWQRAERLLRASQFSPRPASSPTTPRALPTWQGWRDMVRFAVNAIRTGRIEKVVLARTLRYPNVAVDPLTALAHLRQRYAGCYLFLFEPAPGHTFFGATPELLVRVQGSALRTMALAGSVRRGASPEDDHALAQALLASQKDRQEHTIVAQSISRTLSAIATTVRIGREPQVLRLPNIQHLYTPIEATLRPEARVWSALARLHPTPAVGGSPAANALQLMRELELFARGWYAAPIGIADGSGNGEFAVAIRSALVTPAGVTLFAGAGIVADSDPQREWEETALKFRPLQEACALSAEVQVA
ncbi:MAG: isochorismate synthase, partial [Anaerolineae bacterium]|nr:isochorismate synthase [Anaerolineae bacterium]